jgi:ribosome-associated heat shock protein Hsp15
MPEEIRIDKWLWAVRVFKTRTQAADACRAGKIRIDGQVVKASRDIRAGDMIEVSSGPIVRKIEVIEPIKNRVGAKLVAQFAIDLTPAEEYEKLKLINEMNFERRDHGVGRPTKKERRLIDYLKQEP